MEAVRFVNKGDSFLIDEEEENIINAINNKDEQLAKRLIDKFQIKMAY